MPEAEDLEPVYLTLEDALELYAAIIDGSPTQARDQLRSRAGLKGALERPASHAHYESADLALQAAVLAHGIAEGQSFVDGNKRLAQRTGHRRAGRPEEAVHGDVSRG